MKEKSGGLLSELKDRIVPFASHYRWHIVLTVALAAFVLTRGTPAAAATSKEAILDAILMVESGGRLNPPDGDGGRAIGPFQIHEIYWKDAVDAEPQLGPENGYSYQDCRDSQYARQVIEAYMQRWVPQAWEDADAETIARTHNGGPRGAKKRATDKYWARVQNRL